MPTSSGNWINSSLGWKKWTYQVYLTFLNKCNCIKTVKWTTWYFIFILKVKIIERWTRRTSLMIEYNFSLSVITMVILAACLCLRSHASHHLVSRSCTGRVTRESQPALTRTYYRCTIPSSPVFHEKFWRLFLVNFLTSRTWVIKRAEFEDGTPMEERSLELGVLAGWRLAEV